MKISRWSVLLIVVVAIAGVFLVPRAADVLSLGTAWNAHANSRAQASVSRTAAPRASEERAFDYFPDHYVDQAKEPSEPIATF